MSELGITRTYITATNCDNTGQVSVLTMQTQFIGTVNTVAAINKFNRKLETEVFPSVMGLYGFVTLEGSFSALYGSNINISVNGGPNIPYAIPSFCDSLYSPIICPGRQHFDSVTADIDAIFGNISDALGNEQRYMQQHGYPTL
jgi:hypothetical protein